MTKKDYKIIAGILKSAYQSEPQRDCVKNIIKAFEEILASDNPRFDKQKFFDACGIKNR